MSKLVADLEYLCQRARDYRDQAKQRGNMKLARRWDRAFKTRRNLYALAKETEKQRREDDSR